MCKYKRWSSIRRRIGKGARSRRAVFDVEMVLCLANAPVALCLI